MEIEDEGFHIENSKKNYPELKLCIALFNIFLLIDDISLHFISINFKIYFFQLFIAEIIIFYIWLNIRKQFIILEKKKILFINGIYIFISLVIYLFQILKKQFNDSKVEYFNISLLTHLIIHIIFPIGIIIFSYFSFEVNKIEYLNIFQNELEKKKEKIDTNI